MASNPDEPTYEAFYSRAHDYSELLISEAAKIKTFCQVLERIVKDSQLPVAEALFEDAYNLQETVRACFWPEAAYRMVHEVPLDGASQVDDAFNRERWHPYDEDTWQKFKAEIAARSQPLLKEIRLTMDFLPDYEYNPLLQNIRTRLRDSIQAMDSKLQA